MSTTQQQEHQGVPDRRSAKGRFSWVRRLMQGQSRQAVAPSGLGAPRGNIYEPRSSRGLSGGSVAVAGGSRKSRRAAAAISINAGSHLNEANENGEADDDTYTYDSDMQSFATEGRSSIGQRTSVSDNISTIPLKSITSAQSTKSPSILSDGVQDQNSINASTAETSITPSVQTTTHLSPSNYTTHLAVVPNGQERDIESIVTLASSTRRIRRRSIDTNCSTAGIPPASIMERLSVQPTAANSTYAVSIKTNDRTSQTEPSQSSMYDFTDQTSSVRSDYGAEVSA
ncbi:cell wall integrity and stress response component 2 [Scheffersomyces stipitis CBS 6054]|uniref:Cell wall integrity and stress response component 2 n=1 Tax=Scheffersomyces stipitis (strain ATCC 58785 / CBS 6054 / NBRC 10063 / NRRL Y-11545) TaxID=322104 RepID=A3GGZ9_PICST|nr:cell wall integrity and stress response component 2 [Scheffersomyces stipitis CBS 6054]EAZ63621.2 cell wall integrity and stress response component 2 [Scheffersomyces stipitis CBS 6054]KAG2735297.1 hypothetical protein G9P44_001511 [Scheffersomyces stipitis]